MVIEDEYRLDHGVYCVPFPVFVLLYPLVLDSERWCLRVRSCRLVVVFQKREEKGTWQQLQVNVRVWLAFPTLHRQLLQYIATRAEAFYDIVKAMSKEVP